MTVNAALKIAAFVGSILVLASAACGGDDEHSTTTTPSQKTSRAKSKSPTEVDASSNALSCRSHALVAGTTCSDALTMTTSYALTLPPLSYVRARLASTDSGVTLAGAYAGDNLRVEESTGPPSLAFANPTDTDLEVDLEVSPKAGKANIVLSIEASAYEPTASCTAECEVLLQLPAPRSSDAYRIVSPPRYQFGRRELVQMVVAAANEVRLTNADLPPVGIGDFSQEDGEIPGTDVALPRHPAPSHSKGFSIDIAYFRKTGDASGAEAACPTSDRQFCEGPHDLDLAPNVAMMFALATTGRIVQLIVDPMMEADVRAEIARQKAAGANATVATRLSTVLTTGIPFHADHFHISVSRACFDGKDNDGDGRVDLDDPDCADPVDDSE